MTLHCINYTWKKRSARSSPGSAFFGSPIRQSLPKQHLNLGSPSMGNMLKIATSSSFSFARLILSSPTVFVCRCSLLDSRSLNASVAIFPLNWISLSLSLSRIVMQTNACASTGRREVYTKLSATELLHVSFTRRFATNVIGSDLRSWSKLMRNIREYNLWNWNELSGTIVCRKLIQTSSHILNCERQIWIFSSLNIS